MFYPKGLPHAQELRYAGQHLTSIEINGTFYRTQSPASYRKWASEVPDGFVFSLKGPRFAVNRSVLAEAGNSIKRFLNSGVTELGDRLGPLLWQFAPTKKFDEADFGRFLELLPPDFDGAKLRHVVEVRHDCFLASRPSSRCCAASNPGLLLRRACDLSRDPRRDRDFVYARLQKGQDEIATGYPPKALDAWAERTHAWAEGGAPDDLAAWVRRPAKKAKVQPRDVFVYFIHEGKVRAPAAAMALIERLKG